MNIFLIRNSSESFSTLAIPCTELELEVIKEIWGFVLGEKISIKIADNYYKRCDKISIKGLSFTIDCLISMEDWRNSRLEELLK